MILQYLKKKENKDKIYSLKLYNQIIKQVQIFTLKESKVLKNDFATSYEITTIFLFCFFVSSKFNKNLNNKNISQELMNLFISDIDYSLRRSGIGDMNIGKYVKKYVKKFYFRISKLEIIFINANYNDFAKYINILNIFVEGKEYQNASLNLFNASNNLIKIFKKQEINEDISLNLFN